MHLLGVTDMSVERTWKVSAGEVRPGGMPPDTPSLALPFSGLALSHHSWFLWLWLDAPLKNFCSRHSGAPQKCFQSGPHLLRPPLIISSYSLV